MGIYGGNCNMSTSNTQLSLPVCGWGGLGGGLAFALIFNSQSSRTSPVGSKWTHCLNAFLTGSGPITLVEGDGTETAYTLSGTTYTPPAGCYDTLVQNSGGTWTLTRKGGLKLNFTSGGVLSSIVDTNGLTTSLTYTSGLLTTVTDAAGRTLTLGYTSGQLTSVTDCQSQTYTLGYTSGKFTSLTTPPLSGTTYNQQLAYDSGGNVTSLSDRMGRGAWGFVYNAAGQITQTSDGTGIRSYGYNTLAQRTSMTDPRGNTFATYDPLGNLLTQTDVSGRQVNNTLNTLYQLTQVLDTNDSTHADYTYTVDGLVDIITYPDGTYTTHGYDGANRLTSLSHKVTSTSALLVGYAATYDNGNRLTSITELPSGDVTTFSYDNANNLLSETRTGTKPYSGVYTYDQSNRRLTALVVTNGVTTHNGTYTYDGAGRLTQVVDSATSLTEVYTWNNDGSLASAPGSGYTKLFEYDEEQHLTRIQHNTGGTVTTAYEYGYAADGGRRWRKDYINSVWTWYPCGVACNAGELLEQTSTLAGTTRTTSALYLKAGSGCGSQLFHRSDFTEDYTVETAKVMRTHAPPSGRLA